MHIVQVRATSTERTPEPVRWYREGRRVAGCGRRGRCARAQSGVGV